MSNTDYSIMMSHTHTHTHKCPTTIILERNFVLHVNHISFSLFHSYTLFQCSNLKKTFQPVVPKFKKKPKTWTVPEKLPENLPEEYLRTYLKSTWGVTWGVTWGLIWGVLPEEYMRTYLRTNFQPVVSYLKHLRFEHCSHVTWRFSYL